MSTMTTGTQGRLQDMQLIPKWEKVLPANGKGTIVFNKEANDPFLISVENELGSYCLSLRIESSKAAFILTSGKDEKTVTFIKDKECGLENGKIAYWYSYDRDNLVLKYGKGYRMEETTLMTYDFLANSSAKMKDKIREEMHPFFNAEEDRYIRYYEQMVARRAGGLVETEPMVELDKYPFVCNIPPLVLDSSKANLFYLDDGDYIFSSSLPRACKELYDNILNCELNYPEEVTGIKLSDAIRYSIETEGCALNEKLKEKASEFGKSDISQTYLRITLGNSLGKSPGIPYVLEIWPKGHYSPIHDHGNANAVIKVLYGTIHVMNYNKQVSSPDATPLKEFDAYEGDVTWINRNWYQTHKLINISNDYCATIQCYNYDAGDTTHWPYFDYIKDTTTIGEFLPNSDFTFRELREKVFKEYKDSRKK